MFAGVRGPAPRRGTIVPLLALSVTAIFAFVALAIDLGMLTVARTECQNAADAAALAGCRNLDNKPTSRANNSEVAVTAARDTLTSNTLVGDGGRAALTPAQVESLRVGVYDYNAAPGAERFLITHYSAHALGGQGGIIPPGDPPAGKGWTAVEVKVRASIPSYFGRALGVASLETGARALAVHRPRDVAIVLDFSGSMKFASTYTWPNAIAIGTARGAMNPDPAYPQFGHYQRYRLYRSVDPRDADAASTSNAPSQRPNPLFMRQAYIRADSGETISPANLTVETMGGPPIVKDFRTSTLSDGAATPSDADLANAFHHWDPILVSDTVIDRSSSGHPPIVTAATYNYGNYESVYNRTSVVLPAPESYADQADADRFGNSLPYRGDKFPRKHGAATGSAPSAANPHRLWDPTDANGPAVTLAEYLGWYRNGSDATVKYTGGATLPTLPTKRVATSSAADLGLNTNYSTTADCANEVFRDATWERYGYDLDVANYVNARDSSAYYSGGNPKKWDPRWDWNGSAWVHTKPATGNGSQNPPITAANVTEIIKLKPAAERFKGYSMGPGYWGKTFYTWPPDPRFDTTANLYSPNVDRPAFDTNGKPMCDWRRRFFYRSSPGDFNPQADNLSGGGAADGINEALLRNGTGHTLTAGNGTSWEINYRAVLAWLKAGPQVLPRNLRAGRVLYYTSIPDDVPASGSLTDDQRFWREYIDYVLGYQANGRDYDPTRTAAGVEHRGWPEGVSPSVFTGNMTGYAGSGTADPRPYMAYTDNPSRPRAHFWFGPLSMMDFIAAKNDGRQPYYTAGLRNFMAGTVHEAQCWQLKVGIQSALEDIRNNHPNDWVGLTFFASSFNDRRVGIGQNWTRLKNTLFYPYDRIHPVTGAVSGEWRAYDANFDIAGRTNAPNAYGGTDPGTGLANAYNLLSGSPSLSPAGAGRRGAAKIVILETDGVPNTSTTASASDGFVSAGPNSYYRKTGPAAYVDNGDPGVMNGALAIVDQIVAPTTASRPGFSLPNTPARVYAIAFGDLFDGGGFQEANARTFLRDVAVRGRTLNASAADLPDNHVITGDYADRIERLRDCLERIMQSGVQVTLIE